MTRARRVADRQADPLGLIGEVDLHLLESGRLVPIGFASTAGKRQAGRETAGRSVATSP